LISKNAAENRYSKFGSIALYMDVETVSVRANRFWEMIFQKSV